MNASFREPLSPRLEAHVDALREAAPTALAADAAQQRLLARMDQGSARRSRRSLGIGAIAVAACAVLALSVAVFLGDLLGERGGVAFAQVQQHFRDFQLMTMRMEQSMAGTPVQDSLVTAAADGRVRVDVGEQLSVIVDPVRGRGVSLLHGARQAVSFAFVPGAQAEGTEALDWLAEVRDFQGVARHLADTRIIDGQVAHGWALDLESGRTVLWAGEDGLPLAMTVEGGALLELEFAFDFDPQVDPARLRVEVPPGYRTMGGGQAED